MVDSGARHLRRTSISIDFVAKELQIYMLFGALETDVDRYQQTGKLVRPHHALSTGESIESYTTVCPELWPPLANVVIEN